MGARTAFSADAGPPLCHARLVIRYGLQQRLICAGLVLLMVAGGRATRLAAETGAAAILVFNTAVPESRRVAEHYARQRGVPASQMVGLEMPTTEEISRAEFRSLLQEPLFAWLLSQKLFSLAPVSPITGTNGPMRVVEARIRYAVLCYGVPLKIRAEPGFFEDGQSSVRPELRRDEAAVDSELAWLPRLRERQPLLGLQTNAFYATTNAALLHPTNGVLLVARLDGPNADLACRLLDQALAAEADGLWGRAYVDTRGIREGGYKLGDDVMRGAALFCSQAGYDVVVDVVSGTFARDFPLSHVAVYAGWYDANVSGPFTRQAVEFMPGAFAYHLHSFSAATLRSTTAHWAGPLLAKGATVTLGSVYEPYLSGTSDVATLLRNWLVLGFSFGEAAWSSEFGFSWQTTVIGDPLYRPWAASLAARLNALEQRNDPRWAWAWAMQLDRELNNGRPPAGIVRELRKHALTATNAVLSEKLGDVLRRQRMLEPAAEAYNAALQGNPSPRQTIRLLRTLAEIQGTLRQESAQLDSLRRLLEAAPEAGDDMEFQRGLLQLALRAGDAALIERCQLAIGRLSGSREVAGTNSPPGSPPASGTTTNR